MKWKGSGQFPVLPRESGKVCAPVSEFSVYHHNQLYILAMHKYTDLMKICKGGLIYREDISDTEHEDA